MGVDHIYCVFCGVPLDFLEEDGMYRCKKCSWGVSKSFIDLTFLARVKNAASVSQMKDAN